MKRIVWKFGLVVYCRDHVPGGVSGGSRDDPRVVGDAQKEGTVGDRVMAFILTRGGSTGNIRGL